MELRGDTEPGSASVWERSIGPRSGGILSVVWAESIAFLHFYMGFGIHFRLLIDCLQGY
jgi:hypothetical protein